MIKLRFMHIAGIIIVLIIIISLLVVKCQKSDLQTENPVPQSNPIEAVKIPEKTEEEAKEKEESKEDNKVAVEDWDVVKRFKTDKNCYEVLILKVNWQSEFITSIQPIGCFGVN